MHHSFLLRPIYQLCSENKYVNILANHNPCRFETYWLKHTDFLPKYKKNWDKQVVAKNATE